MMKGIGGKGTFLIGIVAALLLGFVFMTSGPLGIWAIIINFVMFGFILFLAGLMFYAIYYIFFMHKRVDVTALNARKIVQSARLSKPKYLKDLYIRGDKEHQSARIGRIKGYCRIENYKGEQEDVFVIKRMFFPLTLIEDYKIIRVNPDDHTPLVGDVFLKTLSLIKIGEYHYINQDMLDFRKIDETLKSEALRTVVHMGYSDIKSIVDIATGLDTDHQKMIEKKKILPLPRKTEEAETS